MYLNGMGLRGTERVTEIHHTLLEPPNALNLTQIAKVVGYRGTVQRWLASYRNEGKTRWIN